MKIAIIIPTLNERESLPLLFSELRPNLKKIEADNYEVELIIVSFNFLPSIEEMNTHSTRLTSKL